MTSRTFPTAPLSALSGSTLLAVARAVFLVVLVGVVASVGAGPAVAHADEVAPELETSDLRQHAREALRKLVAGMPAADTKKLAGVYVAFDASASDPLAQVACDDDGDDVVLLSDAMLRVAAHVARATAYEEGGATRKVEDYAAFLARSQVPGRRVLPPPPGFFVTERPAATYDERVFEILSFVVARELAHFQSGDLACPHPTATKESGDDTWTAAEQRLATETASRVYPGRGVERDGDAVRAVLRQGQTSRGALALLRFFTQLDVDRVVATGRFHPTYAVLHPTPAARAAMVQRVADEQSTAPKNAERSL